MLHFLADLQGSHPNVLATLISVAVLLGLGFTRSALLRQSEGRARTEARASRDAALAASLAKSAFLATMSHEIRTPMNGVIGLTSLLQHTALDQRQRQYVDGVHHAGEALLRIINDILDFSKNEAGKLELDIIDFTLVQVVEEAAELVAEPARNKGLELLAYCSPELPVNLRGRPVASSSGAAEPRGERREVHPRRRGGRTGLLGGRDRRRPRGAVRDHRHR